MYCILVHIGCLKIVYVNCFSWTSSIFQSVPAWREWILPRSRSFIKSFSSVSIDIYDNISFQQIAPVLFLMRKHANNVLLKRQEELLAGNLIWKRFVAINGEHL